ncbi:MAG: phosphatase PAP2 family protein [Cyanobacteria bacterium P01_G01_bin.39]
MLLKLAKLWRSTVNPKIASLVATIGITGLFSCLLITYVVAEISNEVLEKEAFAFDQTILLWIHSWANPVLDRLMQTITRLNDPDVVSIIAAVALISLLWQRCYPEAKIFVINCAGGVILSYGLKSVFGKVRPDLWQSAIEEVSFSYPSGHALGSTVLYGFLAYLFATRFPHLSLLIYLIAIILIGIIGISRLYLGVHWPTDIIGGYGIGFLWLTFCITMLKLQKMRQLQT